MLEVRHTRPVLAEHIGHKQQAAVVHKHQAVVELGSHILTSRAGVLGTTEHVDIQSSVQPSALSELCIQGLLAWRRVCKHERSMFGWSFQ